LGAVLIASAVLSGIVLIFLGLTIFSCHTHEGVSGDKLRHPHETVAWVTFFTVLLGLAAVAVALAALVAGSGGLLFRWAITVFLFQLVATVAVAGVCMRKLLA
jgi:hypothetical protein